jgi:hypothetical protein
MKQTLLFILLLALCCSAGCDKTNEEDRIIGTEEPAPSKAVLLLDFADQLCSFCPRASQEADILHTRYDTNLVVVTIHAYPTNLKILPLVTEEGNAYDTHFKVSQIGHPVGIIDGKFSPEYQDWDGVILERFRVPSSFDIDISAAYNPADREVHITSRIKGIKEIAKAKLLLWIVEDNIIDRQLLPYGITDEKYLHRHIFRASVNTTWGEEISIGLNEEKQWEHHYTLPEDWKAENISIVGFVYNTYFDEVFDVVETHL